jgi:cobalamin biosynthesis protein CobD/CbiB
MDPEKSENNQESSKTKAKTTVQLIWGVALVLAGIGVFFRIPQVMPQIAKIQHFSGVMFYIRFCFYLMGVLLIGGGAKKIYSNYKEI